MRTKIDAREQLYFLAVVPTSPIYDEALAFKEYFKEKYNSKASLNSPPHITLHMPFLFKTEKENILKEKLNSFAERYEPFKVCLDNFSCFAPRVIFISVTENNALTKIQKDLQRFSKKELNLFNANYRDLPFHPHITLAFRDLRKQYFEPAWKEFSEKEYKAEFIADKISLLKHNGKSWDILYELPLLSSHSRESVTIADL